MRIAVNRLPPPVIRRRKSLGEYLDEMKWGLRFEEGNTLWTLYITQNDKPDFRFGAADSPVGVAKLLSTCTSTEELEVYLGVDDEADIMEAINQ